MTTPRVTVPVEPTPDAYKIAASIAPDLFSDDYETSHRAASPYRIDVKQREKAEQVQAVIDLYRAMLSAAPAPEGGAVSIWSDARSVFVRYAELFAMTERYEEASAIADKAAREIEALATRSDGKPEGGAVDASAILEMAAKAVEDHQKEGREWIKGSLWDDLSREAAGRIRALKSALATREEAPAEAGEPSLVDWFSQFIERHQEGCGSDTDALIACLDRVRDSYRAQPPAREDAQPVARVSPDDMAQMTCFADNHGTVEDWHVWCRIRSALTTHPAPDALRVAVEALERIRDAANGGWGARIRIAIEKIATEALAALQAEQKGGA